MKLRNLNITLLLVGIFTALANTSVAQAAIEATVVGEVVEILKAAEINSLNFGKFAPESEGGEITITPNGVRTANGTIILSSGEFNAATFRLHGTPDAVVSILLPQTATHLINPITGKEMIIEDWTTSELVNTDMSTILTNGTVVINVGATLIVGTIDENPIGRYSGSYEVTFTYN